MWDLAGRPQPGLIFEQKVIWSMETDVCVCVTCTRVREHGPCRGSVAVDDYDHLYQQPIF